MSEWEKLHEIFIKELKKQKNLKTYGQLLQKFIRDMDIKHGDELTSLSKDFVSNVLRIVGVPMTEFSDGILASLWGYVVGMFARKEYEETKIREKENQTK